VQAARLLHGDLRIAGGRKGVQHCGLIGEEPEGVEVGAPDLVRLDHLIGPRLAQAQWPVDVTVLFATLPVDHRPLVQPEATQVCRPGKGRLQQVPDRPERVRTSGEKALQVQPGAAIGIPVELPLGAITGAFEGDCRTRVPASQLSGRVHVVGEEEVFNRVFARVLPPAQMCGGDGVDPCLVSHLQRTPLVWG